MNKLIVIHEEFQCESIEHFLFSLLVYVQNALLCNICNNAVVFFLVKRQIPLCSLPRSSWILQPVKMVPPWTACVLICGGAACCIWKRSSERTSHLTTTFYGHQATSMAATTNAVRSLWRICLCCCALELCDWWCLALVFFLDTDLFSPQEVGSYGPDKY